MKDRKLNKKHTYRLNSETLCGVNPDDRFKIVKIEEANASWFQGDWCYLIQNIETKSCIQWLEARHLIMV